MLFATKADPVVTEDAATVAFATKPKPESPSAEPWEPVPEATISSSCSSSPNVVTKKTATTTSYQKEIEREERALQTLRYPLPSNIYSMLFLAPVFSSAFVFAFVIFAVKLFVFGILSLELYEAGVVYQGSNKHLLQAAQVIMIPVAVAIQEDLIESYALIANIRYDRASLQNFPAATFGKWVLSYFFRTLDGFVSLLINYILLLQAPDVLTLMMNFAALQFLQGLDDMAFDMGKNGYLTLYIEYLSNEGSQVTLPRKASRFVRYLDTVLFVATSAALLGGWIWISRLDSKGTSHQHGVEAPVLQYSTVLEEIGMMLE